MNIEQFVMAYGIEQDRIRALLTDGFVSLRPVLRINAEIRGDKHSYVEFNTAVEKDGTKGWLNIGAWKDVTFERSGSTVTFTADFLRISFTGVGVEGGCPAEKDNAGCFFPDGSFRAAEVIASNKEFCDCEFRWSFGYEGAHGKSEGRTLPAIPTEAVTAYPRQPLTAESAADIPCNQVLGSYKVVFTR